MSQKVLGRALVILVVGVLAFSFIRGTLSTDTSQVESSTMSAIRAAVTCPEIRTYWNRWKDDDTRAGKAYAEAAARAMTDFDC